MRRIIVSRWAVGATAAAVALASPAAASAAGFGQLDGGFGGGTVASAAQLVAVTTDASGDAIAAGQNNGSIFVEKLSPSGSVLATYSGPSGIARAITVDHNGRVLVAGTNGSAMLVERLTSSLTLDPSFNSGGIAVAFSAQQATANAIAVTPSNGVVIGGTINPPDTTAAIAAFTSTGAVNSAFGSNGTFTSGFGGYGVINGLAVEPGGQIIYAGSQTPGQVTNAVIGALNANGSGDSSFAGGTTTYHYTPPGGSSGYTAFTGAAAEPNGQVVVSGVDYAGSNALLLRYNPNGSLDSSFGSGGVTVIPAAQNLKFATAAYGAYAVALGGGGTVIGAGPYANGSGALNAAAYATTSSGAADSAFGTSGTAFGPQYSNGTSYEACGIAVAPDGEVYIAGDTPTDPTDGVPCSNGDGGSGFVAAFGGNGAPPVVSYSSGAAPSVATGATSGVGASTATVGGSVNPNGLATSTYFQYGTSANYGSQTASQSAGNGTNAATISAALSNLAAQTTYHYRIVAVNSDGTTYGTDGTFTTTGGGAPAAATGAASRVGEISANAGGRVNANGLATTYTIQYGTSTRYGKTTRTSAVPGTGSTNVSTTIRGLRASTTYHYRIVATNADGAASGRDRTFRTGPKLSAKVTTYATRVVSGRTLTATISCSSACTGRASLRVSSAVARSLKLRRGVTTVASGLAVIARKGTLVVTLTIPLNARATLSRAGRFAATLSVVVAPPYSGPSINYKRGVTVID